LSYNANAIFALCSWPFSLKLLWAPIVDACFIRSCGRRKTWLVPVQTLASFHMIFGSNFVENQLGFDNKLLSSAASTVPTINVKGLTIYFFILYFLMATQDIAVDGWALTLLQKHNRGRGPVCNSIGQNIGYFLSFVGFLAFNDIDSCERIWRPLFRLPSNPAIGLVSLGSFLKCMGYVMLITTTLVALFKHETNATTSTKGNKLLSKSSERSGLSQDINNDNTNNADDDDNENENELDASEIGLKETYRRLWEVCKLPSVRWLFVVLLTYRFPTALSDNVKFLKAVEYGLSKSTTAVSEKLKRCLNVISNRNGLSLFCIPVLFLFSYLVHCSYFHQQ
jgi:MFS transporter, PAT family, solute carrier family 33 (acetyl-CoA transportor), member 1